METAALRSFRADSRTMVRELGFLQAVCAPAGVSHTQVHLLLELSVAGVLRPSELADRLRTDPAVISRALRDLSQAGWVVVDADPSDRRQRRAALTPAGREVVATVDAAADAQVADALGTLTPAEEEDVAAGMAAYAKALRRARLRQGLVVRPIRGEDDPQVTALIRTVMPEFGAVGPGYAIVDPEVDAMTAAYAAPGSAYLVVERDGKVLGAGGYAPLVGGEPGVCELRKMYFLPELRGLGMGALVLRSLLERAAADGHHTCYLETLTHMTQARRLYEAFGFRPLPSPRGCTGHTSCDAWYERALP
ncbi:MAG: bifunctional helix-turn-helix transcriptional regulator/GNAT family N-acetyltransferase [Myxococcales bacterium]|nr:bifunctional helix-turn-helix transcriptional regulator/GNAT family N-acetyltransferase [Myxococcales bacterium]